MKKKGIGVMNIVLVFVFICLIVFSVDMIYEYRTTGGIPDTLCTCVFAALGGECGILGWIKTVKEKNKDRQYELEDREYNEKKEQEERYND